MGRRRPLPRAVVAALVLVVGEQAGVVVGVAPGRAPFSSAVLPQPVRGAERGWAADGWKAGKVCEVEAGLNMTNATVALQAAIDDCGDRTDGGTVLVPRHLTLYSASLFLRSNLTLRVEGTLVGTATGFRDESTEVLTTTNVSDAPWVYTRRNSLMVWAHAGFLNGGRCVKLKSPLVGWDDCAEWSKLENVVIEGGGTIDANAEGWYLTPPADPNTRPMMLDLLWIDGLTIRDVKLRRPGYWTTHPTFCNNVRFVDNDVLTRGSNTDGFDPDSSWNVYVANNVFDTGDDCIAVKAGRDWSGRMVNISTAHVLAEHNHFKQGHGVSLGSETSAWIYDVTIRDSIVDGTNVAVRIKSARGRGGGVRKVTYDNLVGRANEAIQLTLDYEKDVAPTNASATPQILDVDIRNLNIDAQRDALLCAGLDESTIRNVTLTNVTVTGKQAQQCAHCQILADSREDHFQPKCTDL